MGRKNNRHAKSVLEIHDKNGFVGYASQDIVSKDKHGYQIQIRVVEDLQHATKFCSTCELQTVPIFVQAMRQIYPQYTRYVLRQMHKPRFYYSPKPEQISDVY